MLYSIVRYLIQVMLLSAAYLAAATIGLAVFAIEPARIATAVWPAAGIAAAAVLLLGTRIWPGIWLGALLANGMNALAALCVGGSVGATGTWPGILLERMPDVSLSAAAVMATGNTCEALLAAWLCRRLLPQGVTPFQRVEEVFLFTVAACAASLVAATAGTVVVAVGGNTTWPQFLANWGTWWLGDLAGLMILVPLALAYVKPKPITWSGSRWVELAALSALLVLISQAIVGGWLSEQLAHHLLYVPLIFLIWMCLRFELTEVTLATAILSIIAIGSHWTGRGPFGEEAAERSLFHLQLYMILYALTGLAVAAAVAQRRASEQRLRLANQELEQIVRARTQTLTAADAGLRQEVADRQRAEESLRERELSYRELIEHLHVGVVVHAPDTSILLSNQRAAELLDVDADQMPGKTDRDPAWSFVREDGTPMTIDEYPVNRVLATQQPLRDLVYGINRPRAGDLRWVSVNALPEFGGDGELARVVVTFLDITERRQMQERERLRLDAALESIGDSVLITDAAGLIQYVNPAFERIAGYSPAEVLGRNPRLLQSGQHDRAFYRRLWQTLADGRTWYGEFVDKRKDGSSYDTEATISQIRDASGEAIGYVGIQRDISDRKRAERRLAESEARIRAIVETAVDGIITIDERGIIETCNPAVENLFGYLREELIGRNVSLLMPSPEREEHDGYLIRYSQTRQPKIMGSGGEVRGRRKDGTIFPLDLAISETRLGERCFYTGIVRDATPRHLRLQAERKLAATQEQLRLARSIQQSFFPSAPPEVPGYDLGGASYPADETGGDYFDYFPMSGGRVGVVLADVSGHGLGPALVMSQTRAYLRALLPLSLDVSQLVTRLNDFLLSDGVDGRFVTFFLAQLDPSDGRFVYSGAGHRCYLLGPGDEVEALGPTSTPLGVQPGCIPSAPPRTLASGELVLFLTDGVAETTSPQGSLFGIERALEVVRAKRHCPAREIVETLYGCARAFAQNAPQQDDITVVILKAEAQTQRSGLDGNEIQVTE
jgi:sigma-B regulation protein RsbU (phosphoserine phosphatase)